MNHKAWSNFDLDVMGGWGSLSSCSGRIHPTVWHIWFSCDGVDAFLVIWTWKLVNNLVVVSMYSLWFISGLSITQCISPRTSLTSLRFAYDIVHIFWDQLRASRARFFCNNFRRMRKGSFTTQQNLILSWPACVAVCCTLQVALDFQCISRITMSCHCNV